MQQILDQYTQAAYVIRLFLQPGCPPDLRETAAEVAKALLISLGEKLDLPLERVEFTPAPELLERPAAEEPLPEAFRLEFAEEESEESEEE